ncbi:MAG: heavy metal-responsive transcriptional regulator [Acidimicrobiia bacterium]|nr:heavy metal-responsive transcriptional regulator [Acidimicrobiia bacterium]MDH5238367.1 heavy metal-responsive transcriptional regulator [Acidimicrobiia bacterium]
MQIGALADHVGVSTKTIRYYESIGLLAEPERTPAGYRVYDEAALERLRFVRDAQSTGLSLTEIASVLELKDAGSSSCQHTRALLDRHLGELDQQIERLVQARRQLVELSQRARALDPQACTDPNRCQVIGIDVAGSGT